MLGLCGCHPQKGDKTLMSRTFTSMGWERFDFVTSELDIKKPTTYDLSLSVSFDPAYAYNHFSVVFTIFDNEGNPFRSKSYKYMVKDVEGNWKSTLENVTKRVRKMVSGKSVSKKGNRASPAASKEGVRANSR